MLADLCGVVAGKFASRVVVLCISRHGRNVPYRVDSVDMLEYCGVMFSLFV